MNEKELKVFVKKGGKGKMNSLVLGIEQARFDKKTVILKLYKSNLDCLRIRDLYDPIQYNHYKLYIETHLDYLDVEYNKHIRIPVYFKFTRCPVDTIMECKSIEKAEEFIYNQTKNIEYVDNIIMQENLKRRK